MIEGLKPYPVMKDSRVAWLGEIPAHWDITRSKRLFQQRKELAHPEDEQLSATQTYGVIPQAIYEAQTGYRVVKISMHLEKRRHVEADDFVISMRSFEGGLERAWSSGAIRSSYVVLKPSSEAQPGFFQYLFKSASYIAALRRTANYIRDGQDLNFDNFCGVELPQIPPSEQAAIVLFLGHADRKIRRYIRAKQMLIKLLEEQKQAIIHRAVTRGLDPNVRLKPSGLEWLGEVPEHWDLRPAKWFFREVDQRSTSGDEELLSVSHLTGVTPRSEKKITMFMADSYVGHKLCRAGDLVINTMWAWMAALGVSQQIGIVSPAYGVYRPYPDSHLLADYADLLLRIRPYIAEYICRSTGIQSSRLRLYPEQFLRIPILCPPREEQQKIIAHLNIETGEVARATALAHREIDLLREYRTRLIADVVTGKLDVREAAAQLPDEDQELPPIDELDRISDLEEVTFDDLDEAPEEPEP